MSFYVPPAPNKTNGSLRVPITTCCWCSHNQIAFDVAPTCGNCKKNGNGFENEMLWDRELDSWVPDNYYYLGS